MRRRLRRRGVALHHHTYVEGVEFRGPAVVEPYSRLVGAPRIVIGNNFYANAVCHFLGDITIGDDVQIGPKTIIWGRDHGMARGRPMRSQPHEDRPIRIGNDVWIGAGVIILKGVTIGDGAVIGAGSIVTKDIPPYSVAIGSPARVVRERTE